MKITTRVTAIRTLDAADVDEMYELMMKYYHMSSRAKFLSDMQAKDVALLLRDSSERILGFSFVQHVRLTHRNGTPAMGYYFGDTVVDEALWGARVLFRLFLFHAFRQKLAEPFTKHYLLVLSKAYKTYLAIANNCSSYHPRGDGGPIDQELKFLMDSAFTKVCGEVAATYDASTGLFSEHACNEPVRQNARVGITDEMRQRNEKIRLYEQLNPHWEQGVHLACISELRLMDALRYATRFRPKEQRHSSPIARWRAQ